MQGLETLFLDLAFFLIQHTKPVLFNINFWPQKLVMESDCISISHNKVF